MSKNIVVGSTPASVRALAAGLIDYAGLFPPATLGMAEAMANYAGYLRGPHAWMLGRFVVPVARLSEFDEFAARSLARGSDSTPWRVAALSGEDLQGDVAAALKFNCRHWQDSEIGHAIIDSIEVRAAAPADSLTIKAVVPGFFTLYVEVPARDLPGSALDAIKSAGARAKIRTGGVTADAFPSAEDVIAFMAGCAERDLAFKATAGLHHAIRGEYPLTYDSGASCAPMYGFLNLFIAAAVLRSGGTRHEAREVLLEPDLGAFRFDDDAITWRARRLSIDAISRSRMLATSYGSCSFREPVDELFSAGLAS